MIDIELDLYDAKLRISQFNNMPGAIEFDMELISDLYYSTETRMSMNDIYDLRDKLNELIINYNENK